MAFNPYAPQQMYGQYNTLAPYQQRLETMQQQYQQPQPVPQVQQAPIQQNTSINGRAVTGVEEAVASQIPFDGSVSVFTDFSHGKIYTKQLNYQDGSAIFKTYRLEQSSQPAQEAVEPTVEYAPMSEVNALRAKINELEAMLSEKPKAKGTVEK